MSEYTCPHKLTLHCSMLGCHQSIRLWCTMHCLCTTDVYQMSKSQNVECASCRIRRFASAVTSASNKNFKFVSAYVHEADWSVFRPKDEPTTAQFWQLRQTVCWLSLSEMATGFQILWLCMGKILTRWEMERRQRTYLYVWGSVLFPTALASAGLTKTDMVTASCSPVNLGQLCDRRRQLILNHSTDTLIRQTTQTHSSNCDVIKDGVHKRLQRQLP